jgi:hypothetical protein
MNMMTESASRIDFRKPVSEIESPQGPFGEECWQFFC